MLMVGMIRALFPLQHLEEGDLTGVYQDVYRHVRYIEKSEFCGLCDVGILYQRGSEDEKPRMMAVLDPIKLVIDNYPEGQTEYLDVANNLENEELGSRKVPFCRGIIYRKRRFYGRTS